MAINPNNGVLDIINGTLKVSSIDIKQAGGFTTAINTVARNDVLLYDDQDANTTFTPIQNAGYSSTTGVTRDTTAIDLNDGWVYWPLQLPNSWHTEFDMHVTTTGGVLTFSLFNTSEPNHTDYTNNDGGYKIVFDNTQNQIDVRWQGSVHATTSANIRSSDWQHVNINYFQGAVSISLAGKVVLTHKFTENYQEFDSRYVGFSATSGASHKIRHLIVHNSDKWLYTKTSNASDITYVSGNVGIGTLTPTELLDVHGNVHVAKDLTVDGNLTVSGTTTFIDTTNMSIEDPIIELARGNASDTIDAGLIITRPTSNVAVAFRGDEDELAIGYTQSSASSTDVTPIADGGLDVRVYGNLFANNLTTTANVEATYLKGDGSELTGITLESVVDYGNTTSNTIQLTNADVGLKATGNVEANYFVGDGSKLTGLVTDLQSVTDNGNTTSNTIQFTNATTALIADSNVGIGTDTPAANLHVVGHQYVNDPPTLANSFDHSDAPLTLTHGTPTSTTAIDDPKAVLHLTRDGTSGESYGAKASFNLSRYENSGTASRSRLDVALTDGTYTESTVMTLRADGRVGIGTASPGQKLEVGHYGGALSSDFGAIRITNHATNLHATSLARFDISLGDIDSGTGSGKRKLIFNSKTNTTDSGTDILCLDGQSNNVGIGTASPQYQLDVDGGTTEGAGDVMLRLMGAVNRTGKLILGRSGNSDIRSHAIEVNNNSGGANNFMKFLVHDGGSSSPYETRTEVMTLLGSGNVGIGTTSPMNTGLHIANSYSANGDNTTHLNPQIFITGDSGTGGVQVSAIGFSGNSSGDTHQRMVAGSVYYKGGGGNYGMDGYLGIAVANSSTGGLDPYGLTEGELESHTRIVIKNNGNVGIGTTSPIAALDIDGGAEDNTTPALSIRGGHYDTSDLYVLNTYNVATDIGYAAKVIGVNIKNKVETDNTIQVRNNIGGLTAAGAIYLGSDDVNQGIFGVLGADGVAGTTLTEHLTVRAGGNVGIGTTSPAYTLDVHGTSNVGALTATTVTASAFSGNADTATALETPRNINGVSFDGSGNITVNGTNYSVNSVWLRENGDNAHFKQYGNSRQMVFRTDGTTEYASGVGAHPFAWMYGGDAASNRRMLLNTSGQLWCSNYGWLHDKFMARTQVFSDTNANATFNGQTIDYNASGSQTTTADRLHRALFIDVDSSATGGGTNHEHRLYGIYNDVRHSGDSDLVYGMYSYARSDHASGQTTNLRAGDFIAISSGTGTNTNIYGVSAFALKDSGSSGTTANMYGVRGEVEVDAGTCTKAYAFQSHIDRDGGTITTGYLYYGSYSGTVGTKYGVYVTGETKNYFSGSVGIGTTNPGYKLHVVGTSYFTNTLNIQPSSTGGGQNLFTGYRTDSYGRAQLVLSSAYSDVIIASSQLNNNHGSNLSFVTYNPSNSADYRKFVINQGNWGSRKQFLDFGYGDKVDPNPHGYINSTDTVFTLDGINKRVGIRTINPEFTLDVAGSFRVSGGNTSTFGNDGLLHINSRSTTYGSETVALQTTIDSRALTAANPGTHGGESRNVLALQPDGGYVGIGTASPGYKLDVNGTVNATSYTLTGDDTPHKQSIKNSANLSVGWYRIAENGNAVDGASNGSRCSARFTIIDYDSGRHSTRTLYAGGTYGNKPFIHLLTNTSHGSDGSISRVRVVNGSTYEGLAVEIYVDTACNANEIRIVMDDNYQGSGFTMVNFESVVPDHSNMNEYVLDLNITFWGMFLDNTTKNICMFENGNVGIGTNYPTAKLHVNGSIYSPGHPVQYVCHNVNDIVVYNNATGRYITPLDITITPKFSNSKIMLHWVINAEAHHDQVIRVYRGSTLIGYNTNNSGNHSGAAPILYDTDHNSTLNTHTVVWVDTPNTTSAVTYRIYSRAANTGTNWFRLNRTVGGGSTGQGNHEIAVSYKSAMEIAV